MRKCVLPLLLCAVLLCGCGGEKSLTVQDQYRTVVSADMRRPHLHPDVPV